MRKIILLISYLFYLSSVVGQTFDMKSFTEGDGMSSSIVYSITQDEYGFLWLGTFYGLNRFDGNSFKNYYKKDGLIDNRIENVQIDDGKLWLYTAKGTQTFNGQEFVVQDSIQYKKHINSINLDFLGELPFDFKVSDTITYNNRLLVGTVGDGMWIFETGNWIKSVNESLVGNNVYDFFIDKASNCWVASNYGLTKINESEFKKTSFDHIKGVFSFLEVSDTLWVAGKEGVNRVIGDEIKEYELEADANFVLIIEENYQGIIQAAGIGGLLYECHEGEFIVNEGFNEYLTDTYVYDIVSHKGKTYYACGTKVLVDDGDEVVLLKFKEDLGKCYDITAQGDSLWMACSNGLALYSDTLIELYGIENGMSNQNGRVVEIDGFGNVWFGTSSAGLIQFKDGDFKTYSLNNGLYNEIITSLEWDEFRSCLWVGTNEGLHRFNIDNEVGSIDLFAAPTGFPFLFCHNKALKVLADSSIVVAVNTDNQIGNEHVFSYMTNNLSKFSNEPIVIIENFEIWNEKVEIGTHDWDFFEQNINLSYKDNHLTFEFASSHMSQREFVKYQWYLKGVEDDWRPENFKDYITYSNLSPGSYTLNLRAKTPTSEWSETKKYHFIITPPFWMTPWFIISISVVFILVLYHLIAWRQKQIHKKQIDYLKQLKVKADLELKALRAQFNPHFVFNVLNSIQSIILDQEEDKAVLYLVDFSRLMRMTLDYSSEKTISLEEEIEFLELYMSLEQLRFEPPFESNFVIADQLDPFDISVPPLILQPYVENAIKHGLFNAKNEGKLSIKFEEDAKRLKCIIEDNGLGIEKSKFLKKQNHKSKGMIMMQERLDYLNLAYETDKFSHNITDIVDHKGEMRGTRVAIYFPINL